MKLYLDENIPVVLATMLAEHDVDCLTTRDAGNLGLSDEEQLAFAVRERRVLVSFDCRDFLQLATQWREAGRPHSGILLSMQLTLSELLRRFRHFVIYYRDQDFADRVFWLQKPPQKTA